MKEMQKATIDEHNIMTFEEAPSWINNKFRYNALYVRQAYKDIENIIWDNPGRFILVIGNPGIGKSYFITYMLYSALKRGKKVAVQCTPSNQLHLFDYKSSDSSVLLFFDAGTRSRQPFLDIDDRCGIVVFTSPDVENYVDLQKQNSINLCMPVWSVEEIQAAKVLYPQLEDGLVTHLYEMYGGIPRYVFVADESARITNELALRGEISKCTVGTLMMPGDCDSGSQSHKLFHRVLVESDKTYFKYYFRFASSYVRDEVFEHVYKMHRLSLLLFVTSGKQLSEDLAVLQELLAHQYLLSSGTFPVCKLANGDVMNTTFPAMEKYNFKDLAFAIDKNKNRNNIYLVPQSQNYPAVDTIVPPNRAFQMTSSPSHTINLPKLKEILRVCGCASFEFYFVVPRYMFEFYTKEQTYIDSRGRSVSPPHNVNIVEYVLSFD